MILKVFLIFLLVQQNSGFLDKITDFFDKVTDKINKEYKSLSKDVKDIISDAKKFSKANVDTLKNLKQDVISHLKSLKSMTDVQFKGIKDRLNLFTAENLKHFLKNVNSTVIRDNLKELTNLKLKKTQVFLLANSMVEIYGSKIKDWTGKQIQSLKKLLVGLPSIEFGKFSKTALKESIDEFCNIGLSFQQKINLLKSVTKLFGDEESWNSTHIEKLCDSIEGLTPEQILKLSSKQLTEFVGTLKLDKYLLSESQKEAILKKVKEEWGAASTFTKKQIKELGKLVQSFSVNDIKQLDKEKLESIVTAGLSGWDRTQIHSYLGEIKKKVGDVNDWSDEFISNIFPLWPYKSNITAFDIGKVWKVIREGGFADWTIAQSKHLLDNDLKEVKDFVKQDIVSRGQLLRAFSLSQLMKISETELYQALPELKNVVALTKPVRRYFLQLHKDDRKIENLGELAKELTQQEIFDLNVPDILSSLESVTGVDFDSTQVAAFMKKIKNKYGNLNMTDLEVDDILPWGFANLQKMGKVVLALTREELLRFPERDIENSVEVLGKQIGWRRRNVLAMMKRLKEYWNSQNKTLADLTEIDIETLGKFVEGLNINDLLDLNDETKMMAIQKLGEFTGLPEDKLKARATFAYNFLKNLHGQITSSDLKVLNNLVSGLSKDQINEIDPKVIMANLKDLLNNNNIHTDGLQEIFKIAKEHWKESDLGKWSVDQIRDILPTLKSLDTDLIPSINKDVFSAISAQIGLVEGWSKKQQEVIVDKFKNTFGEDVSLWDETVMSRLVKLFNGLSQADISHFTYKTFVNLNEELLDNYISVETAKRLAQRFKEVSKKDLSSLKLIDFKRFHGMLKGFSPADLRNITFENIDALSLFGTIKGWSAEQLKVLTKKAKEYLSKSSNSDDYMSLNNIIRGFSSVDVEKIPNEAFKMALGSIGKVEKIDKSLLKALAKKTVEVWGTDVSLWDEDRVSEAGNILAGLGNSDISKIKVSAIPYVPVGVIAQMDNQQAQALTVEQLSEFDQPQANAIKHDLPPAKAQALKFIADEDPQENTASKETNSSAAFTTGNFVFTMGALVFLYLCKYL